MSAPAKQGFSVSANVEQAVPFFMVADIARSLRFYVDGLGFRKTKEWVPDGQLQWCWLELGGAALMLQSFGNRPESNWARAFPSVFNAKMPWSFTGNFLREESRRASRLLETTCG